VCSSDLEIHLLDEEYNEAIQHFLTAFEIIKSELQKYGDEKEKKNEDKNKLHLYVLLIRTALKLGLSKERKGYYNEAFVIYNTLVGYLVGFRYLDDRELGLGYFYEDNDTTIGDEWKSKKIKFYHNIHGFTVAKNGFYNSDGFYKHEVLPFYRQNQSIRKEKINFLIDGDYSATGLSKVLSPKKQDIISRLTFFSEVKPIFQSIIANLFVVEKIDVNGITQENLDLAEDQFKYLYLLTDSKDKFVQAADFYKKLASILFLKNYSNTKRDEYLQMWGFDIYEAINEFCFINSDQYNEMIVGKFPKEILKEFFVDKTENLWEIYTNEEIQRSKIRDLRQSYVSYNLKDGIYIEKIKAKQLIWDFVLFGFEKRNKYFKGEELEKCRQCYEYCSQIGFNHPCYACNYVSNSIYIFIHVFKTKYKEFLDQYFKKNNIKGYKKGKSYLLTLLEYFNKHNKINSNYFFVLSSALRIKADVSLSCINRNKGDNIITLNFLKVFFDFLEEYYDYSSNIADEFIEKHIEPDRISKLEKTILYYWLSAEYFYLNNSPVDSSECLTKILIIFDKYIAINKEYSLLNKNNYAKKTFKITKELFEKIRKTIIKKVLRNSNNTNNDSNHIETHNLKFILRNRPTMRINLSYLSTTPNIEEILFSYCKLELASIDFEEYKKEDVPLYLDCYKSTLMSQNRFSFTIHEKVLSMEFKERMNMAIFETLFERVSREKNNFFDCDFQIKYFNFLIKYIGEELYETKNIESLNFIGFDKNNIRTKINFLLFLINDSLYCLTQIIEVLSSNRFSIFSNSFIGDIYHQISKWATLYHLTSNILPKYHTSNENDLKNFINHEIDTIWSRKITFDGTFLNNRNEKYIFENSLNVKKLKNAINIVSKKLKKDNATTDRAFETNILNDIGTGNRHFLIPNYSAAMALTHYHKTIEIHSEGREYKEMINKMYIIDDDISNGMHNFSLALERYTMNCGVIEVKMEKLRKYFKDSLSYPLENYLKDTSEYGG
jgi:hypothetical protein